MNIRHATIADLDILDQIEQICFPPAEAASRKSLEGRLKVYPDYFWLLEDEGQVVSFVNGMATDLPDLCDEMFDDPHMHNDKGDWQMIFGVDTIPSRQKQGCAGKVLERVVADAKKRGRKGLVLTCKEHLVHYYAKFGFVSEGVSQSEHGGALWYQMRVTF